MVHQERFSFDTTGHRQMVGDQLVVATKPELLREVIDASTAEAAQSPPAAHVLLRLNRRGLKLAHDDVRLYWSEKSRRACHRNISSNYNLCKLYGVPADKVSTLSEAKYGVRYFCPDGGAYHFDHARDQVACNVHGNREQSHQDPPPNAKTSFQRFVETIDELTAALRFQDEALITSQARARLAADDRVLPVRLVPNGGVLPALLPREDQGVKLRDCLVCETVAHPN
jgi:hypothetical protein